MTRLPIYSDLPVAKQLMAKDIEEAGARLLLSKQVYSEEEAFTPLMLARLEHIIQNGSMPPSEYLLMHWTDNLTDEEKASILAWIAGERAKLSWSQDAAEAFKSEPVQPLPEKVNCLKTALLIDNDRFLINLPYFWN